LISGIRWVEELVTIAGGQPIFPELDAAGLARDRIVDPAEVARRNPEIIFASWCGKRVRKETIRGREGWSATAAVLHDRIFEVKSTYILQPGPACLTEGIRQLHAILTRETRQSATDNSARGGPGEKRRDGASPFGPQINGVLIDVQVDVSIHDLLVHLLCVLAHERQAGRSVGEGVLHAPSQHAVHGPLHRIRQLPLDRDTAERNRVPRFTLPIFAEVDDLLQPLRRIRESVLVKISPPSAVRSGRRFDFRRRVRPCSELAESQTEQEIRRVNFPEWRFSARPPPPRRRISRFEISSGPQFLPSALPASSTTYRSAQ
jgi:hypothetical protein